MLSRFLFISILFSSSVSAGDATTQVNSDVERWLNAYYKISDEPERTKYINTSHDLNITLEQVYRHLKAGLEYKNDVRTGTFTSLLKENYSPKSSYYTITVPKNYSPNKKYPVVFFFHGSINRVKPKRTHTWWHAHSFVKNQDYIQVFPSAWHESKWWHEHKAKNMLSIINQIKSEYSIDTNRIYGTGISDGGSGLFYFGSRLSGIFAGFAPTIGSPTVIADKYNGVEGESYPINYSNAPWLVVNGTRDPLYPALAVSDYINYFKTIGVNARLISADGAHTVGVFKRHWEDILTFFEKNTRKPYPKHLRWEVDNTTSFTRLSWLKVDQLSKETDKRIFKGLAEKNLPRGIFEAWQNGNEVKISSFSISQLTLLISPEQFDLAKPIKVIVNDKIMFDGLVQEKLHVLLKWAEIDKDPNRLYSSELTLNIP